MKAYEDRVAYFQQIPVLVYHKISPRFEIGVTTISPRLFRDQISWLAAQNFSAVTFQQLFTLPLNQLPKNPVVLCFDDGFACIKEYAFPIMQEHRYPGVVFAISGFLGSESFWDVNLGGRRTSHLSLHQLRTLVQAGWEVGSHTHTHRALSYLNTRDLNAELLGSRHYLEDKLGVTVQTVAFPFGIMNRRVIAAAQKAGYWCVTGNPFFSEFNRLPFVFPRIPVFPWDTPQRLQRKIHQTKSLFYTLATRVVRWPAVFSPIYQLLFRRFLWK